MVRCGTSVGANYRSACRSRSKAEFIAKLGIVEEEADESEFWFELLIDGKIMKKELVEPMLVEAGELTAIFTSSIKSAKKNLKSQIQNERREDKLWKKILCQSKNR